MNIIVTNNKVDYSGSFLKVASLYEANQIVGTIDVLVYNTSSESDASKRENLGYLKNRVKTLVYICSEDTVDMAVKMMVIGSDGKYLDDEFFLESSSELSNLVNSLDEITALASLGGMNVLSDFFNRYLEKGSSNFSSNYLMVVREAVNNLMTEYNQKNMEIIQMSETATDVFSTTASLLASMKKDRESMQQIIEKMSSTLKEPTINPRRGVGSSIMFFPKVSHISNKNIIRVKDLGNTRFLTSFMLGFRLYLDNVKNLRPKILFLCPVGEVYEINYNSYKWVTNSNYKNFNYSCDTLFTNYPSKEVIDGWLGGNDYDTYIIVDKLLSDKDHLLNCKGNSVKYAISGEGNIDRFKLSKRDCISSLVEINGVMGVIPMFPEYPREASVRGRLYMSKLASLYEKLLLK